jgi:hypothetical protein
MNKFMLLHIGFEPPTEDVMAAWQSWFAHVEDAAVEHGGFMNGSEISAGGVAELAWGPDAITGYSIIEAESKEAALAIASANPFIKAIRVYEIREHRDPEA